MENYHKEINGQYLQDQSVKQTEIVPENDLAKDSSYNKTNRVSESQEIGNVDVKNNQDENEQGKKFKNKDFKDELIGENKEKYNGNNVSKIKDEKEGNFQSGEHRSENHDCITESETKVENSNYKNGDSSQQKFKVNEISQEGTTLDDGSSQQESRRNDISQDGHIQDDGSSQQESKDNDISQDGHTLDDGSSQQESKDNDISQDGHTLDDGSSQQETKDNDISQDGHTLDDGSSQQETKDNDISQEGHTQDDGSSQQESKDNDISQEEYTLDNGSSQQESRHYDINQAGHTQDDGSSQQESRSNNISKEEPTQDGSSRQESKNNDINQEGHTKDGNSQTESKEDKSSHQKPLKDSNGQKLKQDGSCQQKPIQDDGNHQGSHNNDNSQQQSIEKNIPSSLQELKQDNRHQKEPKQNGCSQQSRKYEKENGESNKKTNWIVSSEEDENEESYDKLECSCRLRDKASKVWFCQHCDIVVCNKCGYGHTHHALCDLKEMTKLKKNSIYHFLIQTQEKLQLHQEAISSIRENKKCYTEQVYQYIAELQKRNEQVKAAVDMVTKQMIESLQTQGQTDQQVLEQKEGILETESEKLQENIKMCEDSINSKNISKVVEFANYLANQKCHILPAQISNPINPPVFIEGEIYPNVIKCLIGCFDYSVCQSKEAIVNSNVSKIIDAVVISSFQPKLSYNLVATGNNESAWLGNIGRSDISMVTEKGKFGKTTKLGSIFNQTDIIDMALTGDEDLLFTIYDGNIIKKLSKYDKLEDFADMTPYSTRGITVTEEEDILICLYKDGDGKINRLTSTGHIVETIKHGYNGHLLFKEPLNVHQNKNGNICIIQFDESHNSKNLVVVDKAGQLKFIYNGPEGVTLDKVFYPWYVVTDKCSNILISDQLNCSIHLLDENGNFLKFLFTWRNGLDWPQGLSIDKNGHLWICSNDKYQKSTVYIIKYLE